MNTIIALAAPLVALIGSIATLIGVRLTQKHNRELKLIELREQAANTLRGERRSVYIAILGAHSVAVHYWRTMVNSTLEETFQFDEEQIYKARQSFDEMLPQIELVATPEVQQLAHKVESATSKCWQTLRKTSEYYYAANESKLDQQRHSSEQVNAVERQIWELVRPKVYQEYTKQDTEQLYRDLKDRMRMELGYLVLDPKYIPTQEELNEIQEELNKL